MMRIVCLSVLITLLVLLGCGGGGGGGSGGQTAAVLTHGQIIGQITMDGSVASLHQEVAPESVLKANAGFISARIFIEGQPAFWAVPDSQGNFIIENVPFGRYSLIARVTALSGREHKARIPGAALSLQEPQFKTIFALGEKDLAEHQIRLQVSNLDGVNIARCKITFWDEEFTFESGGYYLSPPMPIGAIGTIKITPPPGADLAEAEISIDSNTYSNESYTLISTTVPTRGIQNRAPVVSISADYIPRGGGSYLRFDGHAHDPDDDLLTTSWHTTVGTFSFIDENYVRWPIPERAATSTITYTATEASRRSPRLTSTAELFISVSPSGQMTFPGNINIAPAVKTVDITGTATAIITGNTTARYLAETDFPENLELTFHWSHTIGSAISGASSNILLWRSPAIAPGETRLATITVVVEDGLTSVSKSVSVLVTSVPLVSIPEPKESSFYPGIITFSGSARDYQGISLPDSRLRWYVATDTADFELISVGSSTFSYNFVESGPHTVALACTDDNNVSATETRIITILNTPPICVIHKPLDGDSFPKLAEVRFAGSAYDREDGEITAKAQLRWHSDIESTDNGFLGSGSELLIPSLERGIHTITFEAIDSEGAIGSTSIEIYYDMPARLSFLPTNNAVIFAGSHISFEAVATDTDNTTIDGSNFKWYKNDEAWKEGPSFTIDDTELAPGLYQVRFEVPEKAVSETHSIQIGWPLPQISSPASGSRFEPDESVLFQADPDSTGDLNFEWYLSGASESFGQGKEVSFSPPTGNHIVHYIGTDSQGLVASATIGLRLERAPNIPPFLPASGSYIFAGQTITIDGHATDTDGNPIPDNNLQWYKNDTPWQSGQSFAFDVDSVEPGKYEIKLEATGPYGTQNSRTQNIYMGLPAARIISPADGSTYPPDTDSTILIEGLPDSIGPDIVMEWWLDYGTPNQSKLGAGAKIEFIASSTYLGVRSITYIGTDSLGISTQDKIQIKIDATPSLSFTPSDGAIFFKGSSYSFKGSGTDKTASAPILAENMTWYAGDRYVGRITDELNFTPTLLNDWGITSSPQTVNIRLVAQSELATTGSYSQNIVFNYPALKVIQPPPTIVQGIKRVRFASEQPVILKGSPGPMQDIQPEWWLDYGKAGASFITSGAELDIDLDDGIYSITYVATDTSNAVSFDTVEVVLSDGPLMSLSPKNGAVLFGGRSFNLIGSGEESLTGDPLTPSRFEWYLDGELKETWQGKSEINIPGDLGHDLATGTYSVRLVGYDTNNIKGEVTHSIFYGYENARITAPDDEDEFPIGSIIPFVAAPDSAPPEIIFEWSRAKVGELSFETFNVGDPFPVGNFIVRYRATDSLGKVSQDSITILVNNPPIMSFTPSDDPDPPIFFTGQSFELTGSGHEADDVSVAIEPSTMSWFRVSDNQELDTGEVLTIAPGDLPEGQISEIRLTGIDSYGTTGSVTQRVSYGYPLAKINDPLDQQRFEPSQIYNFEGTPDSSAPMLTMEWIINGVSAGSGSSISHAVPDSVGVYSVSYSGQDSGGHVSTDEITIYVTNPPEMVINEPSEGWVLFANSQINFSGQGNDSFGDPVAAASMTWFVDGSEFRSGVSSFLSNTDEFLPAGAKQFRLDGIDRFGVTGSSAVRSAIIVDAPSITSPVENTSFGYGDPVTLQTDASTDIPASSIVWTWVEGSLPLGTGHTPPDVTSFVEANRGYQTIRMTVTDSADEVLTSDVKIIINEAVDLTIEKPTDGWALFRDSSIEFTGSSAGGGIPAGQMSWLVDGVALENNTAGFFSAPDSFATGNRIIKLVGTDSFGLPGISDEITLSIVANPTITSPVSGEIYGFGENIELLANADPALDNAKIEWRRADNNNLLGTGPGPHNISFALLDRGSMTIKLIAEDDADETKETQSEIIINSPPTVSITTPPDGATLFADYAVQFSGSATDSGGGALAGANLSWFVNGANLDTGESFTKTGLSGTQEIKLVATDSLGPVSSDVTHIVTFGHPTPQITLPLDGTTIDAAGLAPIDITFEGNLTPLPAGMSTQWWLNRGEVGEVQMGSDNQSTVTHAVPLGDHIVSYVGVDGAEHEVAATINISVFDAPTVNILQPADGSAFFAGEDISFVASGTSYAGVPVTIYEWYRDGDLWPGRTDESFDAPPAELTAGNRTIIVRGKDDGYFKDSDPILIHTGEVAPIISAPADSAQFSIAQGAAGITLTANPAPANITLGWFNRDHNSVWQDMGTGTSITRTLVRGRYHVVVIGTDSANVSRSHSINNILVNDPPTMSIDAPANGSVFFADSAVNVEGSGTDSDTPAKSIDVASFRWFNDGTPLPAYNGQNSFPISALPAGQRTIRLEGTDDLTISSSVTRTITVGQPAPVIILPEEGLVYGSAAPIQFRASPAPLNMNLTWTSDLDGAIGDSTSDFNHSLSRGNHMIRVEATDSLPDTKFDEVNITVGEPPVITSLTVTSPAQFASGTAEIGGSVIPVYIVDSDTDVYFQVNAEDEDNVDITGDVAWYLLPDTSTELGLGSTYYRKFSQPGSYTMLVVATDNLGLTTSATYTFWLWNNEEYATYKDDGVDTNYVNPSKIYRFNDELLYLAEGNRVISLSRNNESGETTRGDIENMTASTTAITGLIDFDIDEISNRAYTISNEVGEYRIRFWTRGNLDYIGSYTKNFGTGDGEFTSPGGIVVENGVALYITDTGNDRVQKFDVFPPAPANFVAKEPLSAGSSPSGINYITGNVLVAEIDKVTKLNHELNESVWYSDIITGANLTRMTTGAEGRIYVTDRGNNQIHVLNSNGKLLFSVNLTYEPYGITIAGPDLYVTSRSTDRIYRYRSHGW